MLQTLQRRWNRWVTKVRDVWGRSRVAMTDAAPVGRFVKGINFGSDAALVIEGYSWLSYPQALADGLTVPDAKPLQTQLSFAHYTHPTLRAMLNTAIYQAGTLRFSQQLENGDYHLYVWMIENYRSHWHSLELQVDGVAIASELGDLPKGEWRRYGPYPIQVMAERCNLAIHSPKPGVDAHVMGLSIFAVNAA
jgi:hypothetical protein